MNRWIQISIVVCTLITALIYSILLGKVMYFKWVKGYHYLNISNKSSKIVALLCGVVLIGNVVAFIQGNSSNWITAILMAELFYFNIETIMTFEDRTFMFIKGKRWEKAKTHIINGTLEDKSNMMQLKSDQHQINIYVSNQGKRLLYDRLDILS